MIALEKVLSVLDEVRPMGDEFAAVCPHHSPIDHAVLVIGREADGTARFDCQAACEPLDVAKAVLQRLSVAYRPKKPWGGSLNGSHPSAEKPQIKVPKGRKIEGFTAAALEKMELSEPKWAVPGILCQGLNILAGAPKLGKSWLAFSTAIAVATGGKALGKVDVEQGDVLYLALEDTKRRLQDRLLKLMQGDPAPERLMIFTDWPRLNEEGIEWIRQWLEKTPGARLVIIDTLKKVRPPRIKGGSIYDEDYDFMNELKVVADEFEIAKWVLHHVRKSVAEDIFDTVSGSIGLTGAADATQVLTRARGKREGLLHITGRDVEEQAEEDAMALEWSVETGSWTLIGTARDIVRSDERKEILTYGSAKLTFTIKQAADALGKNFSTTANLLAKMIQAGEVEKIGYGKYRIDPVYQTDIEGVEGVEASPDSCLETPPGTFYGEDGAVEGSDDGDDDHTERWR